MKPIQEYINLFGRLEMLANDFLRNKKQTKHDYDMFVYNGNLCYEVNTSCSCHPEMQRMVVDTKEFQEWCNTNESISKLNDNLDENYEE